jgi:hypothetical protein
VTLIERPDPWQIARDVARTDLLARGLVKAAGLEPDAGAVEARARAFLPWLRVITDVLYGPEPGNAAKSRAVAGVAGGVRSLARAVEELGESLQRVYEQDVLRRAEAAMQMDRLRERIANPGQQARFADVGADGAARMHAALKTAGLASVPGANGHGPGGGA